MSKPDKHELKTVQPFFDDVRNDRKLFEVRKHDRDYKVNDYLVLNEYDSVTKSFGKGILLRRIRYVLTYEQFSEGIMPGYCVLGLSRL